MGSMTSSTSPVTATGPALFDSFGAPLTPGTSVGLVMMNKTPGFTFARGTVVEISAKLVVVRTPEGETRRFAVTTGTEVRRGKVPVAISDVTTGEKAVVQVN